MTGSSDAGRAGRAPERVGRARLVAAAILVLAAGPLAAEGGPPPEEVEKLRVALIAQDCLLTEGNAPGVLEAAGMNPDDAAIAIGRLVDEGEGEMLEDGSFRLKDTRCP